MRHALALFSLAFTTACGPAADARTDAARSGPAKAANAPCRATPPAAISGVGGTWIGPCKQGLAEGLGTLRVVTAGKSARLFFGRMAAGRPVRGVMPTPEGDWIPAWSFGMTLEPRDDPSGDRASTVATFDIAAEGAMVASRHFAAAGNAGSARFYADMGRKLRNALD